MENSTEASSPYQHLEQMSSEALLKAINENDQTVPIAVAKAIPAITKFVEAALPKLQQGGRLFYLGAGTSGRLGVVDASECPPTFGVPFGMVVGLIAGGDGAIRKAVEFAEDDINQGFKDLIAHKINAQDVVIGIAASGRTPYVLGALKECHKSGILTGSISCNADAPISKVADFPIEVVVGPEILSGSTRMKAGTAQKLVLNMISTSLMVRMGKVRGNRMVDMQLSNAKLIERGKRMLTEELGISEAEAELLLNEHQNVRKAMDAYRAKNA